MTQKRVSIYDIARELEVSASTVSRALNNHPSISVDVKKSICETARKMGFRPNQMAVALKTGKVRTIGMIVPLIDRNYFVEAIAGVEKEIYDAGYDLIIASSGNLYERECKIVESMSQGKVVSVIAAVAAETTDYSHYQSLIDCGIPVVMFDRKMPLAGMSSVLQDDFKGAYDATRHLLEQGCRVVYHYRGPQNVSIWSDRDRGYRQAMSEYGVQVKDEWIYTAPTTTACGKEYAQMLLDGNTLPEGILFSGDFAAKGAMETFVAAGVAIPTDVAIVGFVNEPWDCYLNPPLSSIEQFSNKIGRMAAKLMFEALEGKPARDVVFPTELIIRESSLKSKVNK